MFELSLPIALLISFFLVTIAWLGAIPTGKWLRKELGLEEKAAQLNIKLLSERAKMPIRGTLGSVGFDLYSARNLYILPGATMAVETDIAMEIAPAGRFFGKIMDRSSVASRGLFVRAGVIDEDYRGNIKVLFYNSMPLDAITITKGERIAQLVILPYEKIQLVQKNELNNTQRGEGGFGSSGSH